MSMHTVFAPGRPATGVTIPSIEWWGLLPVIILAVGAVLLLTIASLARGHLFRGFFAIYTVVVAVAAIVASAPTLGPGAGLGRDLGHRADTSARHRTVQHGCGRGRHRRVQRLLRPW